MKKNEIIKTSGITSKGIPLINENNVADINQVNESLQKIDELLGNNQELNLHKNLSIINENGVHNLKYDPITKSFYYNHNGEWLAVELEGTGNVSVSGLTADVLKTGVTAIVKQGEKEVKRVTGTFTSDANAVASDIISGKTAYVNGNKITGNIATRTGTISTSNPSISGNNLVTPTIPNGYYNNAKISFNRNNLYSQNIKRGINIFGVNGTLDSMNIVGIIRVFIYGKDGFIEVMPVDRSLVNRNFGSSGNLASSSISINNIFTTSLALKLIRIISTKTLNYPNDLVLNVGSLRLTGNGDSYPITGYLSTNVNTGTTISMSSTSSFNANQGYSDVIVMINN